MRTTVTSAVLGAAVCAWAVPPARCQPETQPTEWEYVAGEPRPLEALRGAPAHVLALATVTATVETRPPLRGTKEVPSPFWVSLGALGQGFGWAAAGEPSDTGFQVGPDGRRRAVNTGGRGWIDYKAVEVDGRPVADRWTVIAIDEATAKALVEALLETHRQEVAARLGQAREKLASLRAKGEELQRAIGERQAERRKLEQSCRESGVRNMTVEAIDQAIAQLDHERRLNEIDIAGLQAGLSATRERIAAVMAEIDRLAERGPTEVQSEVMRVLQRLQVESDIQLVGKLARKEALARELAQLENGREARQKINDLSKQDEDATGAQEELKKPISDTEKTIETLEALANVSPVDNRVAISPIARPKP